jgi:uncharacterized protein (DUF58 family)
MSPVETALAVRRRAEALAAPLPPLMVAAERVAATVAQGVHGRRRVGTGESFWQFRRYQPGDVVQRIDWRQTAKSQAVYIREYEWEASQTVWLWRDGSASMSYRSDRALPDKRERADLILLALAALLSRAGERVALLGGDAPPATGRVNIARLAAALVKPDATAPAEGGLPPPADLPRHAELVLLGDFLDPLEAIDRRVAAFADRGVRGHLLQVLDPAEQTLPFRGRVRFAGLEREADELVPRVEAVREQYLNRLEAQHDGLETIARHAGWSFTAHRTDHPAQAALLALYMSLSQPVARLSNRF